MNPSLRYNRPGVSRDGFFVLDPTYIGCVSNAYICYIERPVNTKLLRHEESDIADR
ncbi:hypothetical protein SAMN05428988_2240 [Chitinophaga sp. YR573]|nr:hypothetical protein SAMN05428988_2240 [Chitinophaga sp. YR573]